MIKFNKPWLIHIIVDLETAIVIINWTADVVIFCEHCKTINLDKHISYYVISQTSGNVIICVDGAKT